MSIIYQEDLKKIIDNEKVDLLIKEDIVIKNINELKMVIMKYYFNNKNELDRIDSKINNSDINYPLISSNKLRKNQQEFISYINNNYKKSGLVISATGSGKTLMIGSTIQKYKNLKNNTKIFYITQRVNIVNQLKEMINNKNTKLSYVLNVDDINVIDSRNASVNFNEKVNENKPNLILMTQASFKNFCDKNKQIDIDLILCDEVHGIFNTVAKYLIELKKKETIFYGFSATPIRNLSNLPVSCRKLEYKNKKMETEMDLLGALLSDNNTEPNIIVNYDLLTSMKNNFCLCPNICFYTIDVEQNELEKIQKQNEENIEINGNFDVDFKSAMNILNKYIQTRPYKKIIVWCRLKSRASMFYNSFNNQKKNYENLSNIKLYKNFEYDSSTEIKSNKKSKNDLEDFSKESTVNSILITARKNIEGSDIPRLDTCLFFDSVSNRSDIITIQSIGRVLRNENIEFKKNGLVIDYLPKNKNKNYTLSLSDKIIKYYKLIYKNITSENDMVENDFKNIIDSLKLNQTNGSLEINYGGISINLNIDVENWSFNNIINVIGNKNLSVENYEKLKFEKLKYETRKYNITSIESYEETMFMMPEYVEPNKINEEFSLYWKGWDDFLFDNLNNYPETYEDFKKKVVNNCTNEDDYNLVREIFNLPIEPSKFYVQFTNFTNIFEDSNISSVNKYDMLCF